MGASLTGLCLGLHTSIQGAWVQSLIRELRSYKLFGMAETKKQTISVMGLCLCETHAQFGLQERRSFLSQLNGQRNMCDQFPQRECKLRIFRLQRPIYRII